MKFLSYLFGCRHNNYSFPITRKRLTYVTCFDCGKELKYDFQKMRIVPFDVVEQRTIRCEHYGEGVI